MASMLATIRNERIQRAIELKKRGINPYPSKANRTKKCLEITTDFTVLENKSVTVLGRIITWRDIGKIIFAKIRDYSGEIQLFVRLDDLSNSDKDCDVKLFDIGDFIECEGKVIKTKTGEISVQVEKMKIISKAIRPLPDKWKGIVDPDTRIRRRYLDMVMNPELLDLFTKKAIFWQSIRDFMNADGFIEIRTPVLEHTTGGADAKPFETYYNALDTDFFLRISLELPLKKAIGGGFEKVYEIGPVFRNEGIDEDHLQDYDMMEFYMAYGDYRDGMNLMKRMYRIVAEKTIGGYIFQKDGMVCDLEKEWEEIDYNKEMNKRFGMDTLRVQVDQLRKIAKANDVDFDMTDGRERLVDKLWKIIRREIAGPAFIVNEPKFMSPLAKSTEENPNYTERYHIIMCGSEMGNGYSELNDPIDQYDRFIQQQNLRDGGDDEAQMLDIDFVEMLEYGMPPVNGFGMSERFFSYLVGKPLRQTMMFPQIRREVDNVTREIYSDNVHLFEHKKKVAKSKRSAVKK